MFHSDEAYYCIILGARKGKHALEKASMQSAIIIKVNSELGASLIAESVKNGLAMQKNRVRFLGWEDPLEKGMVTHSSILAGESHGQRSLAGYSPWGCKSQIQLSN